MSQLNRITFTGLDDYTNIDELVKLEKEFSHVNIEWGILFSAATRARYPSELKAKEATTKLKNCAAHLCGKVFDTWYTSYYEEYLNVSKEKYKGFKRIQLNFNARQKPLMPLKLVSLMMMYQQTFLVQYNASNYSLINEMINSGIRGNWEILFDASGGRGKMTTEWPLAKDCRVPCNYAGGLGPDNLEAELVRIKIACPNQDFGVDMEGNIRTNDRFDVSKIRQCLEIVG